MPLFSQRPNGAEWHFYLPCVHTPARLLWDWLTAVQISLTAVYLNFSPEPVGLWQIWMDDSKLLPSFLIFSSVVMLFISILQQCLLAGFRVHTENLEKVTQILLHTPLWHCVSLTDPAEFTLSQSRMHFDPVDVYCRCDKLRQAACWREAKCWGFSNSMNSGIFWKTY